MPSWGDEYLSALQERDKREKANEGIHASYTKLADRTASLQAKSLEKPPQPVSSPQFLPKSLDRKTGRELKVFLQTPAPSDTLATLRQDLGEAQRSRGLLEIKLQSITEELLRLKIQSSLDHKRIGEYAKEQITLARALGDRDEEIRGKAKLLEDVHDETVSLTLQLNMADERAQTLERENAELVERWMKRMGEEADEMNERSKFS